MVAYLLSDAASYMTGDTVLVDGGRMTLNYTVAGLNLEAFAVSTGVVALGEMGDKTQLLALLLAARFRAPRPIILGILVATLANHALAAALGAWLTQVVDPLWLRWGLGLSFIAVALWMLVPDQVDAGTRGRRALAWASSASRWSPSSWPRWATRPRSPPSCSPRATRRW